MQRFESLVVGRTFAPDSHYVLVDLATGLSFGPVRYHPVGGEKLADCEHVYSATGLYEYSGTGVYEYKGQRLQPIIRRDEDGYLVFDHWKRDPQTGRKWRPPHWPPIIQPLRSAVGGWAD
jgi:hypothetical protein